MDTQTCCFIGCEAHATIEIYGPKGFDDYTYSCEKHVRDLFRLGDITYAIKQKAQSV